VGLIYMPVNPLLGGARLLCTALINQVGQRGLSRMLVPVHDIRAELAEITIIDLGRRVPEPAYPPELKELTETINGTLERLEKAVSRQQRFAANVSHELRSPIAALRTQLDLALSDPEPDVKRTLHGLDESVGRLQLLVEDLLTITKLDSGTPRNIESINLAELVRAELTRRADKVNSTLGEGALIEGDRLQLSRALTNLVDNAARHAQHEVVVSVHSDPPARQAVLEVIDDGGGIDPADRERVFQRFIRLAEGRRLDKNGSGLGLPIAKEIAERHGGTLNIADGERGARLVLRLPLAREHGA
jgi:signal transduction histidine kinase